MDEKHIPSPPDRTTAQYEADKAAGINSKPNQKLPVYATRSGKLEE